MKAAPSASSPANSLPQSYAPQPTPELLQGFDTAIQITALAHWLRHQPSPALPLAARAFALARLIGLPPAPLNAASCFGMLCASPFGGPLGPLALGSRLMCWPVSGQIVGCRGSCLRGFLAAGVKAAALEAGGPVKAA